MESRLDDSNAELVHLMAEKAHEIFRLFDQESKGFITKKDLLRLQDELPQTPEQLESVFDNLDIHGNGYLTLDEFTEGFGSFLGLPGASSSLLKTEIYEDEAVDGCFASEAKHFDDMFKSIGAQDLLQDVGVIKSLWIRLHQNQPEMLNNFEDFLRRITSELKRTHMNYEALQASIENKKCAHDEEIRALYMEMESQISAEKERICAEEKAKERLLREKLEVELKEKDRRLQELLSYQDDIENQLMQMNANEVFAKNENEKLLKEKEAMEELLDCSAHDLEDSRSRIAHLQSLHRERTRTGSQASAQINEWIVLERESLLIQLQELKDMNRRLLDSQDELERQHQQALYNGPHIRQRPEILGSHVRTSNGPGSKRQSFIQQISYDEPDTNWSYINDLNGHAQKSDTEDLGEHLLELPLTSVESRREQPIGSSESSDSYKDEVDVTSNSFSTPQRLYKVVFVGDSGVGKSSYIYRICKQSFMSSFATTIGVDFQVYSVNVDGQLMALQLWDTAGQERFRSITKQYFRKADGVLVMYDVTSDISFRSLREWLEGIKETVDAETVILIVGNKMDAIENDSIKKAISYKHGQALAREYGALFFETSAKTGLNVTESVQQMARLLRDREDKELKKVLDMTTCTLEQPTPNGSSFQQKCCKF